MKKNRKFFTNPPWKGSLATLLICLCAVSQSFAQCGETTDTTISSSTVWNTNMSIHHNIEVTTGSTLSMSNATFSFVPGVKITIDYGAHLILNDAILNNQCADLWGGIVIVGDTEAVQDGSMSSISVTNSQINYAQTGIMMGDGTTDSLGGGGILTMSGSSINNCYMGVVFYSYPDSNISIMDSSSFTCSAFLPGYDSTGTDVCLSLYKVYGITIAGCSFISTLDDSLLSKVVGYASGIFAVSSGYSLVSTAFIPCHAVTNDPRICCAGSMNEFKNLGVAISNYTNNGVKKRGFNCQYTNFIDNYIDIYDHSSQYTLITKCNFTKDAAYLSRGEYPKINTTNRFVLPYYPLLAVYDMALFDIYSSNSFNIGHL